MTEHDWFAIGIAIASIALSVINFLEMRSR